MDTLTYRDAVCRAIDSIAARSFTWILAINPEKIMKALADTELRRLIRQADLFIPDGIGILWAGKLLGRPFPQRVTGVDLLLTLVEEASVREWKVYLLGAAPGVADDVARLWREKYPALTVAGCHDGYFKDDEEEQVVAQIRAAAPDLLFVGMGSPRQETFIVRNAPHLDVPVCMGVGGSFDVLSGRKKRAPVWMQKTGMEWSYRLVREPLRIFRLSALPRFMALVLREKWGLFRPEEEKE